MKDGTQTESPNGLHDLVQTGRGGDGLSHLVDQLSELELLLRCVFALANGPEIALADPWAADHVGEGQDVLLDLRGEAEQAHGLGHPGGGDALPARDVNWKVGCPENAKVRCRLFATALSPNS